MSAAYTLHVAPFADPGDARALDRADLVRDSFAWGAFLVPMLWFFRHRHWLLGIGALAVVVGLAAGLWALGISIPAIVAAEIVLHLLCGLEGPTLRRWAYARAGRPAVDVVTASDEAEAESKTFARWLAPDDTADRVRPARRAGLPASRGDESIIGLFPDYGGRR